MRGGGGYLGIEPCSVSMPASRGTVNLTTQFQTPYSSKKGGGRKELHIPLHFLLLLLVTSRLFLWFSIIFKQESNVFILVVIICL